MTEAHSENTIDKAGLDPASMASTLDTLVYIGIVLTTVGVFAADFYTPLGVAVWVIYLIPVALTLFTTRPAMPLATATAVSVLMVITFITDDSGINRDTARANRVFGIVTVWVIAIVGYQFIKSKLTIRREEWIQSGQLGLNVAMNGEQRTDQLGDAVLRYLAEYLRAHAGALFAWDGSGYRRIATYGVPRDASIPTAFQRGDGLLGQAAKDRKSFLLHEVPDGYLTFGSGLGQGKPRHLLIAPVASDGVVNAVLELGFLHVVSPLIPDLMGRVAESISVAFRSADYREHLQNLLEETQRQAEELQTQGEELRVTNEELEEQSRALKESQSRLELQQAELEQTNTQLEEQTQLLETQRDELEAAKSNLEMQKRELEQASRYKSDFLANMSHELRTPLNSSLILAKLLADNPEENLTDEQVKYAKTIQAAGNDLLALINDILDLSKIEAGRMEVHAEPLSLAHVVRSLAHTFEPVAGDKGIRFVTETAPDCPETIVTDRQRLEQVLKNLLSNAIKFTAEGEVKLSVAAEGKRHLAIAVTDTGIGIDADQQSIIFEAFRQADGTTNRRYGGTGLGLSISRELVRLLGGEIKLTSTPGRGSTFSVVLPVEYDASAIKQRHAPAIVAAGTDAVHSGSPPELLNLPDRRPPPVANRLPGHINDDRASLTSDRRTILIVEDDEAFARILYDLTHELHFQCLIAQTGEEALAVAAQFVPHAVILDIGLPDHSGLTVLDRLKHDQRTRHIPVHVVSAGDYAQTALSLGAVGYMLKPVKREELAMTLEGLESRLSQRMRRVLVVEDDQVQRDSLQKLLGSHEVETVGAASAAECLDHLRRSTFDCMVLDISLPDASGYSLLETLSREDSYSFPPVIVYTGRDLSSEEEQRLRRYSKSIIIKGAKSPERLLDEVTLFLHQVVSELPAEQQRMLERARSRDAAMEGRRVLIVEDDVRNVFALTSILEPRGAVVEIARNGKEALAVLEKSREGNGAIDLVLMDVMMPEMDGLTATREIRKRSEWKKLPIIMLTAKAMAGDQEKCLEAGANDYMAKPLDVEKLLSLVRVWMPR